MSPASRRTLVYWLLLLLPTLVAGAGAILLLQREQARIGEQSEYAVEAGRAAAASRARLIVENVELLLGDVQEGLLDALEAESPNTLDGFLDQWERTNPLVRSTFRATIDGRMLRPAADVQDEEARGFLRRFSSRLRESPPWKSELTKAMSINTARPQAFEGQARGDVSANVSNSMSARRDVQEILKNRDYSNTAAEAAPSPTSSWSSVEPSAASLERYAAAARAAEADVARARVMESSRNEARARDETTAQRAVPTSPAAADVLILAEKSARKVANVAKLFVPARRGWSATAIDGRLHLLGWLKPADEDEVRGVELDLPALVSRFGGSLPVEVNVGEGYALRDDLGRVIHQVGAIPRSGDPVSLVPISADLLPGWDVVAFLATDYSTMSGGSGFFWIGALLVMIFVTAILAGGSLLLWQARRSEAEAAQKTSFVANVSHEFKTPLTTIRLYAELLEQGRVRDAAQESDYLNTIARETQRLARLVNNALDFSRLEQGRKKYARDDIELVTEINRLLDTHEPRVSEAGLTLRRSLPTGPIPATTDRDALEQIVINLLDNACKYAADGGEIVVTVDRAASGRVEVRVADRGPGVPAEHRERIFDKFHRVDDALTAEKSGAGLGLSIARQLARGLGGDVSYLPRDGGGAEFILELPWRPSR